MTIEIWRPGRHDRRPRGRQDQRRGGDNRRGQGQGQGAKGGQGEKRHGKGGPKGEGRGRGGHGGQKGFDGGNRRDKTPRDKPIDPNSPFAALMALKANMDSKDKK